MGWGLWKREGSLGGRGLDRKRRRVRNQCYFIFVSLLFLGEEKTTYMIEKKGDLHNKHLSQHRIRNFQSLKPTTQPNHLFNPLHMRPDINSRPPEPLFSTNQQDTQHSKGIIYQKLTSKIAR
jgi:hypothetical protein